MSTNALPRPRARRRIIALVAVAIVASPALADIRYDDFSSTQGLTFVGAAAQTGTTVSLTPPVVRVAGAMWYSQSRVNVAAGFDTEFTFRISDVSGTGADGIAFVIQDHAADALGGTGGGIGYGNNIYFNQIGIARSLAVEFDSWNNAPRDWDDLSENHVSIHSRGVLTNDPGQQWSLAAAEVAPDLSSGTIHSARVLYASGILQVYLNGGVDPVVQSPIDLSNLLGLDSNGVAWVGFTSATGGEANVERHEILSWRFATIPAPSVITIFTLGATPLILRRRCRGRTSR